MSKKGSYPRQASYPRQPAVIQPQCVPTVQFPQPPSYTEPPPSYAEIQRPPGYVHVPPYVPVSAQMQVNPTGAGTPVRYYAVPQITDITTEVAAHAAIIMITLLRRLFYYMIISLVLLCDAQSKAFVSLVYNWSEVTASSFINDCIRGA
ncbi:DAZ-associated protein 2 isoform X1 [Mobula hypostoma]|uniref:DAZ-associated protein 2 isoform X1 n=1 Tax=Mobula hypostoma TaxID=723540 RepID=UPI002FC27970